jgi:hypothetical protein
MLIETRASHPEKIYVSFEPADFELRDNWGAQVWYKAKEEIKDRFHYSVREWDKILDCWLINNTPDNMKILNEINQKYFIDVNQMEMFE